MSIVVDPVKAALSTLCSTQQQQTSDYCNTRPTDIFSYLSAVFMALAFDLKNASV